MLSLLTCQYQCRYIVNYTLFSGIILSRFGKGRTVAVIPVSLAVERQQSNLLVKEDRRAAKAVCCKKASLKARKAFYDRTIIYL